MSILKPFITKHQVGKRNAEIQEAQASFPSPIAHLQDQLFVEQSICKDHKYVLNVAEQK